MKVRARASGTRECFKGDAHPIDPQSGEDSYLMEGTPPDEGQGFLPHALRGPAFWPCAFQNTYP